MLKKKILFQLNYLYHIPAVEPIIELFANDNRYDVAFQISLDFQYKFGIFRKRISQSKCLKYFPRNVRTIEDNEEFDVVFGTDVINNSNFKNTMKCIVYHGPTFNKTVTYRELHKHLNDNYTIFVESQFTKNKLMESNSIGNSKTEVVGFPKLDPYINKKFEKNEILDELGLDANRKTILYAPTYKPTSLFHLKDEIFKVTQDYNLIIKLHHYSWMGKYANRNQSRLFIRRLKKYSHSVLLPQTYYNIIPLYNVADTLISEASGALTEFLITEKVGIIYNLKEKYLIHTNSEPLLAHNNDYLREVYINISSPDELSAALIAALNPTDNQLKKIKKYKERYFYKNDGKASERIKTYIDNLLL